MELIVGGAFQGQLEYGKKEHPEIVWADGGQCTVEELYLAEGVFDFQEFIKRSLLEENDIRGLADELHTRNPNLIVVSNEVGYGIVPVTAFDRKYRESVGRICTQLAAYSDTVVRVICGIGTVIKGA